MGWYEAVLRFLGLERPRPRELTAASAGSVPVSQDYPTQQSMSAMAGFPYVRACVTAIATDLSGLPLVAVKTMPDGTRRRLPSHPVLEALARPSSNMTGRRLRRQLVSDFVLTGNAFLWLSDGAAGLGPFVRLHPSKVRPEVDAIGQVVGCTYNTKQWIPASELLHVADVSWSDRANQVLGESAIRALHQDLTTLLAAKRLSAKTSQRGRPDVLIRPAPGDGLGDLGANELSDKIDQLALEAKFAWVLGEPMEVTQLSWSPRDLEFIEQNRETTFAICSVFGVPGVRIGLESSDFATAKVSMRMYWEGLKNNIAALFNDELSRLTGDPTVRIEHDFTDVEALQVSYNDRLARVQVLVGLGMDPNAALEWEGFLGAPRISVPAPSATPAASPPQAAPDRPRRPPEEPQGTRRALTERVHQVLQTAAADYATDSEGAGGRLQSALFPLIGPARALHARRQTDAAVAAHLRLLGGAVPLSLGALRAFGVEQAARLTHDLEVAA